MTIRRRGAGGAALLAVLIGVIPGRILAVQAPTTGQQRNEKGLYLLKVDEPGYQVTITETARSANCSTLDVRGVVPTVTAAGTVLFRAIYDIAKERRAAYVFIVRSSPEDGSGSSERRNDGRLIAMEVKAYFTNDSKTPISELLGSDDSSESR